MAHTLQERYSKLIDMKLRATLVKKDGVIFNNRYEGDPKAGKVKVPVRDTEVAIADYSKTDGATATHGDTTYLDVSVDKDKAVNEIIDGYDAAAVPDDLVADRLDSAAYSLALQIEKDATAELESAATTFGDTTALDKDTIYDTIVDVRTKMSEAYVPNDNRRFCAGGGKPDGAKRKSGAVAPGGYDAGLSPGGMYLTHYRPAWEDHRRGLCFGGHREREKLYLPADPPAAKGRLPHSKRILYQSEREQRRGRLPARTAAGWGGRFVYHWQRSAVVCLVFPQYRQNLSRRAGAGHEYFCRSPGSGQAVRFGL